MPATPSTHNHSARYIRYALIIFGLVLVGLLVFLFREYRSLRRAQMIGTNRTWLANLRQTHQPLSVSEAGIISPWMTFDYINRVFNLPPTYLKDRLQINDSRYPRLSLSGYARNQHLDTNTFVNSVISTVRNYQPN